MTYDKRLIKNNYINCLNKFDLFSNNAIFVYLYNGSNTLFNNPNI